RKPRACAANAWCARLSSSTRKASSATSPMASILAATLPRSSTWCGACATDLSISVAKNTVVSLEIALYDAQDEQTHAPTRVTYKVLIVSRASVEEIGRGVSLPQA